jgi:hypothetical protein|nr:MAG TPA: hypothetical protein [Caudoviricetes sp.]
MANKKGRAIIKSSEKPISKIRNFDTELFKWSFKSYYSEHKCWCELGGNDVITNIIHKLEDYSTQTWSVVKSASGGKREGNGSNNHYIPATTLPKDYQEKYIKSGYMRDFEKVFSLRLTGKKRLIGYVSNGTFYPLWYDNDHLVFPVKHKR